MTENVLPLFSFRSLMVSCLIFKSLSHFEFIFVHGVRVCSSFTDLHAAIQFPSTTCWKESLFHILYSCHLCQRLTVGVWAYFWVLYSVPWISMSVKLPEWFYSFYHPLAKFLRTRGTGSSTSLAGLSSNSPGHPQGMPILFSLHCHQVSQFYHYWALTVFRGHCIPDLI